MIVGLRVDEFGIGHVEIVGCVVVEEETRTIDSLASRIERYSGLVLYCPTEYMDAFGKPST